MALMIGLQSMYSWTKLLVDAMHTARARIRLDEKNFVCVHGVSQWHQSCTAMP